jgi:S1-C subfamily serine protease
LRLSIIPALALAALSLFDLSATACAAQPEDSVVRVRSIGADGSVNVGSGVILGPEYVATACHVTRRAARIEVTHGMQQWQTTGQTGSALHDLCVLHVPISEVPRIRMRAPEDLHAGEAVTAIGFQGTSGELMVRRGVVAALYAYDGSYVIRTSAAFDFGASGGGLFDEAGNLVGILAFKARTGENLRFALPSDWLSPASPVATSFNTITAASNISAFWERTQEERPSFLGVALREVSNTGR